MIVIPVFFLSFCYGPVNWGCPPVAWEAAMRERLRSQSGGTLSTAGGEISFRRLRPLSDRGKGPLGFLRTRVFLSSGAGKRALRASVATFFVSGHTGFRLLPLGLSGLERSAITSWGESQSASSDGTANSGVPAKRILNFSVFLREAIGSASISLCLRAISCLSGFFRCTPCTFFRHCLQALSLLENPKVLGI